ncbi:hypothetical protein [Rhodococcus jostii]
MTSLDDSLTAMGNLAATLPGAPPGDGIEQAQGLFRGGGVRSLTRR